ncbi:hypothetical protein KUTeg_009068 [Tegillarca granosa]|uniref:Uncharacterized protein n=1 Tax=Tegillarca granosa TaxID=220873 RepID=A0ABQ9FCG4_TEGGR|nr:hypothetical protein KUTeg_009068 [Tegillarca granosa]
MGAGNAVGTQIPPFLVFPGTRIRSELLDNCTAGCDGCVSESGWSNTEIFKIYIRHQFMKYVQAYPLIRRF